MSDYSLTTNKTWSQTLTDLATEFRRWDIEEWETNKPRGMKFEGWNQSEEDRMVYLRYKKDGREVVLEMGSQSRAVDNLRVLYLAVNSMRLNELRGIGKVLESAYKQLAGEVGVINLDPYAELKITKDTDLEVAEAVYRTMARKYHPDSKPDGSAERMERLNVAINMIRKEKSN